MIHLVQSLRNALALVASVLALLSCAADAGTDAPAGPPKRVLILQSFGRDFALWNAVPPAFKPALAQQVPFPIEFHEAAVETARSDQPEAEAAFADYLRTLYADRQPDLIVPVGVPAAEFLWRHRASLFPRAPVVIGGIDQRMLPMFSLGTNDTAVVGQLDVAACFNILWQLFPETTYLVMVMGNSPLEKLWVAECKRAFQPFTNRLHVVWLNDLSLQEMCRRVASLPPRSVIAYGSLLVDAAGVPHEHLHALERLCAAANAPVFGTEEEELGHGIIGGSLVSARALGLESARVAARVLRGEPPGSITPPLISAVPAFDWRELRRWDIPERQLPPGSVVHFRQPSAWDRYRLYIITVLLIIIAQGVTIIGLVINHSKRRAAEASVHELAGRLIGVQENERREIAAKLHDGLGQDLLVIASQAQLSLGQQENPPATVQRLNDIAQTAKEAIHTARQMAHNLRPGLVNELGLTKAIRAIVEKAGQASGISMDITLAEVDGLLPPNFEVNMFRIVQESLNNLLKHAGATRARVALSREPARLRLVVEDNGRGFNAERLASQAPDQIGLGLRQITERATLMRGRVVIQSRPAQGTRLTVDVPLKNREAKKELETAAESPAGN